jgi:hypothetical protein
MSSRTVNVDIRCGECGAVLMQDEPVHAGEAIIVDGLLEDHYCEEQR